MHTPELLSVVHAGRRERLARRLRRPRGQSPPEPTLPAKGSPAMDTQTALARFEAAVAAQVAAAGGDQALEAAASSLLAALGPASRQLALDLAEQAATEVGAQLPGHEVDVVLRDGEPVLAVREPMTAEPPREEDYEARITLRLPPSLKTVVEQSAGVTGDSVNTWVVKALSSAAARPGRTGRHFRGTVQT